MLSLATPIEKLPRVGPRMLARLKHLGINTVRDLLWNFPTRYQDFGERVAIADLPVVGTVVCVQGRVKAIETVRVWKRRLVITTATVVDETGSLRVVWFNQPFIEDMLREGTLVSLAGKLALDKRGLYLSSPSYEKISMADASLIHTGGYVPVYAETHGITSKYIRFLLKPLLDDARDMPDPLPADIVKRQKFMSLPAALRAVHFPESATDVEPARARFAFEELLIFQLRALIDRQAILKLKAPTIAFKKEVVGSFVKTLPFPLTDDQRLAAYEILQDLAKTHPMNRLLNGDVGSGKTAVALLAAYETVMAGWQVAFLAPTEILARQHFATAQKLFASQAISFKIGLLTGGGVEVWPQDVTSDTVANKKDFQKQLAAGRIQLVIGTHAVIQKSVAFKNLGLVVIDEQHRFGVSQRKKLVKNQTLVPHLLSMTATPIPRTLALTIYGDLDVSIIKQKPAQRLPIVTKVVSDTNRARAYEFIDQQIAAGRQVFVICPRIEESKTDKEQSTKKVSQAQLMWADVKAVTQEYEKLAKVIFPKRRVVMLHGKMKPKEKDAIMIAFRQGQYDILVSTSVVEVGVDVPNATVMMIESAERFGLAQLHQFRGRVGRGSHQSYCFLFTSNGGATKRLTAMEKADSGFELAEMDLKIRGPGEFTGVRQSGVPDLVMSSLADIVLIKQARQEAKLILEHDPELAQHPLLKERVALMQKMTHFE